MPGINPQLWEAVSAPRIPPGWDRAGGAEPPDTPELSQAGLGLPLLVPQPRELQGLREAAWPGRMAVPGSRVKDPGWGLREGKPSERWHQENKHNSTCQSQIYGLKIPTGRERGCTGERMQKPYKWGSESHSFPTQEQTWGNKGAGTSCHKQPGKHKPFWGADGCCSDFIFLFCTFDS